MSNKNNSAPTAQFGFNVLKKEVAAHPGENVLVSPISLSVALAMTANGARGQTLAGMLSSLGLSDGGDKNAANNQAYANLLAELKGSKLGVKLAIANALWAKEGFEFEPDFLTTNWKYFKSAVNVSDFAAPETLEEINKWCSDNTNGKIDKILDEIDPLAVMFLLNAVYFKGEWTNKFDKDQTSDQPFAAAGGSKSHPLMYRNADMRYTVDREAGFQMVALPFGQAKRISLYVILPEEGKTVNDVLSKLDGAKFLSACGRLRESEGHLWLPRFELDYDASLNETLKSLGMSDAFDSGAADFTGMSNADKSLHIGEVKHKTFAKFDEEGGEAAAVTAVTMVLECLSMSWTMRVDKPFVAVLADETTGAVLFNGVVVNP
jgi:serpin B